MDLSSGIALAGNPNCGKTTLFNALTGLRQKVANYPGVTVEKKTGRAELPSGPVMVVDLPGTYSLLATSPDERVAMEVLRGLRSDTPPPAAIVAVVDASNLARNLYLLSQLLELGRPLVVALNMTDIAARRGQGVDADLLARHLGVPVIPVVGHRRTGIDALRNALASAQVPTAPNWSLPDGLIAELEVLAQVLRTAGVPAPQCLAMASRLLAGDDAADIAPLVARPAVAEALEVARDHLAACGVDPEQTMIAARYRWIDSVTAACVRAGPTMAAGAHRTYTERVDAVLVHPVFGLGIFALIMASLFVTIFWVADPLMGVFEGAIAALGTWVTSGLAEGALKSLLSDGVFAGVGAVIVFVPQIALLFGLLAILEDSGYLARAAFLMDRLLSKVGLHGKSFIPLLSSFACAIPGVMAARTIENPRERLATMLVAPFMSCSARLPVYALLIGTFFAHQGALVKGGLVLGCYALGVVVAAATAYACKLFLDRGAVTPFILELPTYKAPQAAEVLRQMWVNTTTFVTRAGTTILALTVILWALAYYPRLDPAQAAAIAAQHASAVPLAAEAEQVRQGDEDHALGQAQLAGSYVGRFGHTIEPLIAPLGYDWKMGVGLIGAFAAREVFVSTMGVVYGVGDVGDNDAPLSVAILADRKADGSALWTPAVAISLLVWFVLAMQCLSTVAVMRRETGGWRWPLLQLVYMNTLAWIGAFAAYHLANAVLGT